MVSWKKLTRWCRRRLIHLHNQNKHPHPLIWARGFAPPPKKTSLLTKSSLSSWFVQHSQPRAFVLPWLSWKILLVYFFQFGHFGGSVPRRSPISISPAAPSPEMSPDPKAHICHLFSKALSTLAEGEQWPHGGRVGPHSVGASPLWSRSCPISLPLSLSKPRSI